MNVIIPCETAILPKSTTGMLAIPDASIKCSLSKVTLDLGGGQCITPIE